MQAGPVTEKDYEQLVLKLHEIKVSRHQHGPILERLSQYPLLTPTFILPSYFITLTCLVQLM